jgi:hypothetical protein
MNAVEQEKRIEPEPLRGRPPCYYYEECASRAEVECGGRAVCRACAARMGRPVLPLRDQEAPTSVRNGHQLAMELRMVEPGGLNASEGSWFKFAGSGSATLPLIRPKCRVEE